MENEREELEELSREVRKVIADNRKFLNRILDEGDIPEDDGEDAGADEEPFEEL